ncbi:MAG TPA: dihydroorotase [Elusimicrobiales bacterium]|nr:dihydroorotase [Elusimicrobiales bacterium]HOL62027.1 dihydroorotase [Elusimicrobiales bacterium]HPO96288.1 dihydroorotase [Elusimicrobiales bacterium]
MILLKNAFVINGEKLEKKDILISQNRIRKISDKINNKRAKIVNANGLVAIPSLIDIHVHSRVPGKEEAEDFLSLTRAALSGGVGTVLLMPNTEPATDNPKILKTLIKKAKKESCLNMLFSSAATKNRQGSHLVDVKENSKYAVSFTDDGTWIKDSCVMEKLLILADKYEKKVFSHPQTNYEGFINEGKISKKLNIKGINRKTEYMAVLRDCILSIITNTPLHLQHISVKESIEIIKEAKKLNPKITAETAPHYFCFTEENIKDLNSDFKMNPPLRTEEDRLAIIKALKDGTIDAIATDHAPHTVKEKAKPIEEAPFGVIGLETMLSASITELFIKNKFPLSLVISLMTSNPAKIINIKNRGIIKEGYIADISLIDIRKKWNVKSFYSKSENSPFKKMTLTGKNIMSIINGKIRYENDRFFI